MAEKDETPLERVERLTEELEDARDASPRANSDLNHAKWRIENAAGKIRDLSSKLAAAHRDYADELEHGARGVTHQDEQTTARIAPESPS